MAINKRWHVVTKKGRTLAKFATRNEARGFKVPYKELIFDTVKQTYVR